MKVYVVKKSRVAQGACGYCHKDIPIGTGYKAVYPKLGAPKKRHLDCPSWRPSELTTSDKLAVIYGAQEEFEDLRAAGFGEPEDMASAMEAAAEQIREAAEGYRESASNIEDGFGHSTYQSDELNEKADSLETWADDIESNADDVRSMDEEDAECEECGETEESGPHHEYRAGDDPDSDECVEDECGKSEVDHHDYEEPSWEDDAEQFVSVMDDCPV